MSLEVHLLSKGFTISIFYLKSFKMKTFRLLFIVTSTSLTGLFISDLAIQGATINWSGAVGFNGLTTGQIFTNTPGTIVGAVGFGIEEPVLVNFATNYAPVLFDIFTDPTVASVSGSNGIAYGTGTFPAGTAYTTGNTNFDSVLDNFVCNNKMLTINLINLVPGATYSVQLFSVDDRTGSVSNTVSFQNPTNGANTSSTFASGTNAYMLGTFTVPTNSTGSLTNFTIQQNLSSTNGVVNALVVRAVSFLPSINFTQQPQPTSNDVGGVVSFSAMATGPTPLAPQWQYGPSGGPYTNLTNGSHYSGVNTYSLTISNVVPADATNIYLLKLTSGTNTDLSKPASLAVTGNAGVTNTVTNGGNIQTAINAVSSAGGGMVILGAGTYTENITNAPYVTLKGDGSNNTTIVGTVTVASYSTVEDLKIDLEVSAAAYSEGVAVPGDGIFGGNYNNDTTNTTINNVEVTGGNIGMQLLGINGCFVNGCNFHDNGVGFSHSIYFTGDYNVQMSNSFSGWCYTGDGAHLDFTTANYTFTQDEMDGCSQYGILCQGGTGITPNLNVTGCVFKYNGILDTNNGSGIFTDGVGNILSSSFWFNDGYATVINQSVSVADVISFGNVLGDIWTHAALGPYLNASSFVGNQYFVQQAVGVSGPNNTADWTTNYGGNTVGSVDFNANHSVNGAITWPTVSAPSAGSYPIKFVYSNGSSNTLAMPVEVNGVYVGTALFPPTGAWNTYLTNGINANLSSSNNSVTLSVLSPGLGSPELSEMIVNASMPSVPLALTGLSASANTNAPLNDWTTWITLSWNPSSTATYYNIKRNGVWIATGATNTTFIDKHILGCNVTNSYSVWPVNAAGTGSGESVTGVSITGFPATLTATGGPHRISLSWSAPTNPPTGQFYTVYRSSTTGGPYKKIATTPNNSYTDLNTIVGETYYYVVTACNGITMSTYSPQASAVPYVPYSGSPILIDVDLGTGATQNGAAVLGTNGDHWNAVSATTSRIINSAGTTLSGVALSLSANGLYTDTGGTSMDSNTTPLMEDYADGYTSGTANVTISMTGLSSYRGANVTLVVYAAGDASGQGASLSMSGATGGNSTSALSTSATSRHVSAGNGVAYQTYNGTLNNGILTINATELSGQSFTVITGLQLYLTAP